MQRPPHSTVSISSLLVLAAATSAFAQVPEVPQPKQYFEGKISGSNVTVRAGPGENYYRVLVLQRDTPVLITGIKFDWLRIAAPEGSFSYVAKRFVDVNGATGRINGDNVNVRAGSTLTNDWKAIQTKLSRGDVVEILGEATFENETYLKIKSPPGASLYVFKDFVTPVRAVTPPPEVARSTPPSTPATPTTPAPTPVRPGVADSTPMTPGTPSHTPGMAGGTTRPTRAIEEPVAPAQPTPAELARSAARDAAEKSYEEVENAWAAVKDQSLENQPLPDLITKYDALAKNEDLPYSLRNQAARMSAFLKSRNTGREEIIALKARQQEMIERLNPGQNRARQAQLQYQQATASTYVAAGQLQTSLLGEAGAPLLRLVDPATGYTLIYIANPQTAPLGQFVGVKGTLRSDDKYNIQVITPTSITPIDPATLGTSVTAEISPNSMRKAAPAPTPTPAPSPAPTTPTPAPTGPGTTITPLPSQP